VRARDAGAFVGHRDHHARPARPSLSRDARRPQADRAAPRPILQGVVEQVLKHLGELVGIRRHRRQIRWQVKLDPGRGVLESRLERLHQRRDQGAKVDLVGGWLVLGQLDVRKA